MSINEVRWLSECGSTNAYAKEHFEEFGPVGAVYTTNQTAGRGRLGRAWVNAAPRPVRWAVYEFAIFAFLLMASFYSITGFLYARF